MYKGETQRVAAFERATGSRNNSHTESHTSLAEEAKRVSPLPS